LVAPADTGVTGLLPLKNTVATVTDRFHHPLGGPVLEYLGLGRPGGGPGAHHPRPGRPGATAASFGVFR